MQARDRGDRSGHRFAIGLIAACLVAGAALHHPAAAQDADLTRIVVAMPDGPSARTIGYHLAKAGGWFARVGLDPEFVAASGRDPATILADGDADLAIDIMPHALKARAGGAEILHVAQIFQRSGLLLACRRPIKEPKDLKGMNVALWSGGEESPFYAWMQKLGLGIFGESDGVTILREGRDPDSYRDRSSDCFTSESYTLPAQLALQNKTPYDYRIFLYEDLGTATLEDGLYAREGDVEAAEKLELMARFLTAARAGWQGASDEPRKAAEYLAEIMAPPAPDLATLLRAVWAANDLVQVRDLPFGHLDPAAYDRTVTVLLTGAPDPTLKTAPLGAVSGAVIARLEAE